MADKSAADILDEAADLLSKPGAWTQGAYARGRSGRKVITRQSAVCFCAIGAIDFVQGANPGDERDMEIIGLVTRSIFGRDRRGGLPDWNDMPGRTQDEVVAKLKEAADLARVEASA